MDIIGKKYIYFAISIIVLIPGIISLVLFGLKTSIDFTGGSRFEYQLSSSQKGTEVEEIIEKQGVDVASIQSGGKDRYLIRTKPIDEKKHQEVKQAVTSTIAGSKEIGFETVGPIIGQETTINAVKSVVVASLLIVIYIAFSFWKVPKPASSIRFGVCAIVALIHDVLVVIGLFSILGYLLGVEVDSMFVTALLTVIGFSVHDTIVVFDRIRENLRRMPGIPFAEVVNASIIQTFGRSLNTSITVLLVLFTLLLFGGESTKWFVVALLVGILSGTYSSIFNAAPLLVVWQEFAEKRKKK